MNELEGKTAVCDDCGTEYTGENPIICSEQGCKGAVFWL